MANIGRLLLAAATAATVLASTPALPASAESGPGVVAANRRVDEAQAKLNRLNDAVEREQGRVDALDRQLQADQERQAALSQRISGLARYQYEQPTLLLSVFSAGSLSEAFGNISQMQVMGARQRRLLAEQQRIRERDRAARAQVVSSLHDIEASRGAARDLVAQALAAQAAARDEDERQRASALAAQARATSAPAPAAPMAASRPSSIGATSGPNHFSYGYCTWYVANRRYIPWFGNAAEWWPNARAYGYAEGQSPQVGAVMVTLESGYGHVAYVESVGGDGSWTVSEMNFGAWGVVSGRTLRPGQAPVLGFIYGRS